VDFKEKIKVLLLQLVLFGFQFRSSFSGLDSITQICVIFLFVLVVSVFSLSFRYLLPRFHPRTDFLWSAANPTHAGRLHGFGPASPLNDFRFLYLIFSAAVTGLHSQLLAAPDLCSDFPVFLFRSASLGSQFGPVAGPCPQLGLGI
jgi:hypothetical protein